MVNSIVTWKTWFWITFSSATAESKLYESMWKHMCPSTDIKFLLMHTSERSGKTCRRTKGSGTGKERPQKTPRKIKERRGEWGVDKDNYIKGKAIKGKRVSSLRVENPPKFELQGRMGGKQGLLFPPPVCLTAGEGGCLCQPALELWSSGALEHPQICFIYFQMYFLHTQTHTERIC